MQIDNIKFTQGEEGAEPCEVTATLTIQEALWIAKIAGKQRGDSPHSGIYSALVGDVFNRYWEDGTDEAQKQFRVNTPPIRYDEG